MNEHNFAKMVSGQRCGLTAALLRLLLRAGAFFYGAGVAIRNILYSSGIFKIHKAKAAVISIGNITAGGTGKTPLVIWLCNLLRQENIPFAVLTRGYKTKQQAISNNAPLALTDEPAVIADNCPSAKIIINPDRVAGARQAIEKFGSKVLVLDDGFQHRRLARDLDIVVIDATEPFGFGKLLPAGLLREPVTSLKRADAFVITRCDQIEPARLNQLIQKIQQIIPSAIISQSIHKPIRIESADNRQITLDQVKGKKVFVFCGIGNPSGFVQTIKNVGCQITGTQIYNDHYQYKSQDIVNIQEEAKRLQSEFILTTQKDWARLKEFISEMQRFSDIGFGFLLIELKITSAEEQLRMLIKQALAGKI